MACGFSGNNEARPTSRKWSREIEEEDERSASEAEGYERGVRERETEGSSFPRLIAPEKKLEVVLLSRRSVRSRETVSGTSSATASPPYVIPPPLFCSSRCLLSFFPRGVRRLRGAMPCYPHDVWRANCTSDEPAIVSYNEIDHLIVRAQFLLLIPPSPPPQNLLEKSIFLKRVRTLEMHIFAFIKKIGHSIIYLFIFSLTLYS